MPELINSLKVINNTTKVINALKIARTALTVGIIAFSVYSGVKFAMNNDTEILKIE